LTRLQVTLEGVEWFEGMRATGRRLTILLPPHGKMYENTMARVHSAGAATGSDESHLVSPRIWVSQNCAHLSALSPWCVASHLHVAVASRFALSKSKLTSVCIQGLWALRVLNRLRVSRIVFSALFFSRSRIAAMAPAQSPCPLIHLFYASALCLFAQLRAERISVLVSMASAQSATMVRVTAVFICLLIPCLMLAKSTMMIVFI
jgi:hypothetical protein